MNFHNYEAYYATFRKGADRDDPLAKLPPDKFYTSIVQYGPAVAQSPIFLAQVHCETNWYRHGQPYYKVWPGIASALTKFPLDVGASLLRAPYPSIAVRFPEGQEPIAFEHNGRRVPAQCFLMSQADHQKWGQILMIWIDYGEAAPLAIPVPIYTYQSFSLAPGSTVEEALGKLPVSESIHMGLPIDPQTTLDCVRLACALCFLDKDPSIIEPEVLADDLRRFEDGDEELRKRLVAKAQRRGKVGWNVGRQIEVTPHVRRPHFAIRWTERGRAVPKLVPVKGSVVHRQLAEKVPTGFGGDL